MLTVVYILYLVVILAIYLFLKLVGGSHMLMHFSDLWKPHASIVTALGKVWFIFAWAAGVSLLSGMRYIQRREARAAEPAEVVVGGLWISLNAGFFEELIWRWLIFFNAMVMLSFFSWITFGFVGWLYRVALIPFANWATFGALAPQLISHHPWVFGAAVISANSDFRDQHKYLGRLGYINSWFIGMVMFWLMFNYGLMAAIVAHILYDACIFTVRGLLLAFQPRQQIIHPIFRQTNRPTSRQVERDWQRRVYDTF